MENTNRYKSEDKKVNKAPKLINKLALSLSAFHSHIESQYNHRDLIFVYYEFYANYKKIRDISEPEHKQTGHKPTDVIKIEWPLQTVALIIIHAYVCNNSCSLSPRAPLSNNWVYM